MITPDGNWLESAPLSRSTSRFVRWMVVGVDPATLEREFEDVAMLTATDRFIDEVLCSPMKPTEPSAMARRGVL